MENPENNQQNFYRVYNILSSYYFLKFSKLNSGN